MNQFSTNIHYMTYPHDNDVFHQKIVEIHENNDNIMPLSGKFFGLLIPENQSPYPFTSSLYEENQYSHNEEINNDSNITYQFEPYQERKPNSFPPLKEIDETPSSPTTQSINKDTEPSKVTVSTRTRWTKEEERLLIQLVKRAGARRWNQIAAVLKTKTAKQCRDHYANCLDPEIKNSLWTVEEEQILLMKYQEYGSHWAGIKKFLPGRTTSMIKNYVTMLIKKNERGLSHEFQPIESTKPTCDFTDENSSSCNSNVGSDNDDHCFSLNLTDAQNKYDSFNFLDIESLLNRPTK